MIWYNYIGDFMITRKDIILEGNELLRKKCKPIKFPVSDTDKELVKNLLHYVILSQDEEKAKFLDLKPAVGLASPQIGVTKRCFAMVVTDLDGEFHMYGVINPKIIKKSEEMTYLNDGEGCLSVERDTFNYLTPRHKEIEVSFYNYNLETEKIEHIKKVLKGYASIVFQHEYDHLDGILYVDKMYEKLDYQPLFDYDDEEVVEA